MQGTSQQVPGMGSRCALGEGSGPLKPPGVQWPLSRSVSLSTWGMSPQLWEVRVLCCKGRVPTEEPGDTGASQGSVVGIRVQLLLAG